MNGNTVKGPYSEEDLVVIKETIEHFNRRPHDATKCAACEIKRTRKASK